VVSLFVGDGGWECETLLGSESLFPQFTFTKQTHLEVDRGTFAFAKFCLRLYLFIRTRVGHLLVHHMICVFMAFRYGV